MSLVQDKKTEAMPYPVYSSQTKSDGLSGFYSEYLYENAITWTTDGANAGEVNYRAGKFYCTNVCGVLLSKAGYANEFVAALINSVSKKYVSYVGNPKLMNGVMSKIKVPLPSMPEQQKIADCLSSVDELITVQSQKLESLKAHKKGLLQHLFPAEGETVPKLRFPEFRDNWQEAKMSNCVELVSGRHLSPDEYSETGKIPYFTGPSDFTNSSSDIEKWTKESSNYASVNDVLITVKGSGVGELWYLTLPCVAMGRQLMAVRAKSCSSQFIYQFLATKKNRFEALGSGNLIPGLSREDILQMHLSIPSPKEQQKIANCLSSIDKLITVQTQKINMLKTHKKGLMQQLFPSPEGV